MASPFIGKWAGGTVACLASGPSLTREDAERVRHLPTIVTNTTFRLAPWADVLLGHDAKWWLVHGEEVEQSGFAGTRAACAVLPRPLNAINVAAFLPNRGFGNSGAAAIALAMHGGASRIILLGFDCKRAADGRTHWHGAHPAPLGDAKSIAKWAGRFAQAASVAQSLGTRVINCTRDTALTCFDRMELDDALASD